MLGSLLGRIGWSDLPSSFTYTIKEEVGRYGVFTLHNGQHKTTKDSVTIFVCDKKGNASQTQFAVRAMRKCKSIKHPSFLRVLDTADVSSGVYIVTEEVTVLESTMMHGDKLSLFSSSLTWNLYVLVEGISFLHQHADACHGSLCPQTIFVTPHGEWKIGGLDVTHTKEEVKNNTPDSLIKEYTLAEYKRLGVTHPLASSLWASAHNHQVYPSDGVDDKASPVVLDRIAFASLAAWAYARASSDKPPVCWRFQSNERFLPDVLSRLCKRFTDPSTFRIEAFDWEQMKSKSAYFRDSDLVQCMLFFANVALKGNWDKELFYDKTLPHLIEEKRLSPQVQTNLVLPRLIHELETAVIPPSLLPIMVQLFVSGIALVHDTETFQRDIYGCFQKLMLSNERSIRYYLLQFLPKYQDHLTTANALQLFDAVALGLSDSSPELRDVTLRAMLVFIPKIASDRACLDRGFKRMARCLQTDEAQFIRTNAVICYAKLVESSSPQVISDYIAPQFLVGMKDSFNPARLAALQGLCTCMQVLSPRDKALKYLPAICPRLLDDDPQTQSLAFHALEILSHSLKNEVLVHTTLNDPGSIQDSEASTGMPASSAQGFQAKAFSLFSKARPDSKHPHCSPDPLHTSVVSPPREPSSPALAGRPMNSSQAKEDMSEFSGGVRGGPERNMLELEDSNIFRSDSEDDWGDLSSNVKEMDMRETVESTEKGLLSTSGIQTSTNTIPQSQVSVRSRVQTAPETSPKLVGRAVMGISPPSTEEDGAVDNFWDSFNAGEPKEKEKKKSLVLKTKRTLQKPRVVDAE